MRGLDYYERPSAPVRPITGTGEALAASMGWWNADKRAGYSATLPTAPQLSRPFLRSFVTGNYRACNGLASHSCIAPGFVGRVQGPGRVGGHGRACIAPGFVGRVQAEVDLAVAKVTCIAPGFVGRVQELTAKIRRRWPCIAPGFVGRVQGDF